MRKSFWRVTSIILPSLCMVSLFVLSMPTPKAKAELQELTATVEQVLTINIPTALNFNIDIIDEQWHEIPFQVGISSNNKTGYTFTSDIVSSMRNTVYTSKTIAIDEKYSITYPTGAVKETKTHVAYPNSDNSALDKKYDYKLRVLADSYITNGTYTGAMSFFATTIPTPSTIAYINYLDEISNDIVLTMTPGKYYQLKDRRDGKKYWIVFEGGEVKMAQNLDYDISSSVALSANNTNISTGFTYANSTITGGTLEESWVADPDTPQSYDEGVVYRMSDEDIYSTINACVRDGYSEWECYRSAGGNYYNWSAAVASNNTATYDEDYVAEHDICPKNWQLPVNATGDFISATIPDDKAAAGKIRCYGIKPSHLVHIIIDNHYQAPTEKIKNNTAWGITSFILPKDIEYGFDNSHELAGWSTHPNDVVPDYIKGSLFETDQSEINLYAVWRDKQLTLDDITYMQEITPTIAKNTEQYATKQLIDARDNKKYWVTKFGYKGSGNIIMTQNLDFDMPSSMTYTTATSDVDSDRTYSKSSGYDFNGGEYYYANGTTKTAITDFAEDDERWHYHIGNYYSPYNAKLGYNSENWYENTRFSICPKGWGIPTIRDLSNLSISDSRAYLVKGGYLASTDIVSQDGSLSRYLLNDYYYYDYYSRPYHYYTSNFSNSDNDRNNSSYGYNVRCIVRRDYNVNNLAERLMQRQDDYYNY